MFASGLVGRAASCLSETLLGCYPGIYCAVILIKAFECWQVSIVRGDVWLIAYFFVTAINRMLWGCMLDSKQFPLEWDEQMDLGAISAFHLECEIGEKPKLHWPFNVLLKDVIGWKKKKASWSQLLWQGQLFLCKGHQPQGTGKIQQVKGPCFLPAKLINVQIKKDVRALKKHLLTKVKK